MSISPIDIDDCDSYPCVNGDCVDGLNSYTCDCYSGYTGVTCETGEIIFCLHRLLNLSLSKLFDNLFIRILKVQAGVKDITILV